MKTAVDTSVLLDVLAADPRFGEGSRTALRRAYDALAGSDPASRILACRVDERRPLPGGHVAWPFDAHPSWLREHLAPSPAG